MVGVCEKQGSELAGGGGRGTPREARAASPSADSAARVWGGPAPGGWSGKGGWPLVEHSGVPKASLLLWVRVGEEEMFVSSEWPPAEMCLMILLSQREFKIRLSSRMVL